MNELLEHLGLGALKEPPRPVSGGLMHKMYHIVTEQGEFALKVLNENVMQRKEALQNTVNSEIIAQALAGTVPVVAAITLNGQQVHHFSGAYFILYPWKQGQSIFPPQITQKHCYAIGTALGAIHQTNVQISGVEKPNMQIQPLDWQMFVSAKGHWSEKLKENLSLLKVLEEAGQAAAALLQDEQVISHRDMDPKNVLWDDDRPLLIDWEAAGYVNPWQEVMENLFYWADDGKGGLQKGHLQAFLAGYKEHHTISNAPWQRAADNCF